MVVVEEEAKEEVTREEEEQKAEEEGEREQAAEAATSLHARLECGSSTAEEAPATAGGDTSTYLAGTKRS